MDNVPKIIKPRKKSNFFDAMYNIEDNINRTSGVLITGHEICPKKKKKTDVKLGTKSYFKSGLCSNSSSKECIGKPRYIELNNLPGDIKNNKGLIPSIIGDFGDFEPVEIFSSFIGKGNIVNDHCSFEEVENIELYPNKKPYIKKEKLCISKKPNIIENFTSNIYNNNKKLFVIILLLILFVITRKFIYSIIVLTLLAVL